MKAALTPCYQPRHSDSPMCDNSTLERLQTALKHMYVTPFYLYVMGCQEMSPIITYTQNETISLHCWFLSQTHIQKNAAKRYIDDHFLQNMLKLPGSHWLNHWYYTCLGIWLCVLSSLRYLVGYLWVSCSILFPHRILRENHSVCISVFSLSPSLSSYLTWFF